MARPLVADLRDAFSEKEGRTSPRRSQTGLWRFYQSPKVSAIDDRRKEGLLLRCLKGNFNRIIARQIMISLYAVSNTASAFASGLCVIKRQ